MKINVCVGRVAAILAVLVLSTTACSFHVKTDGIATTGKSVERLIDVKMPSMLHQVAPDLPLGHARCPGGLMELDHGQIVHCTFELGAVALPIRVTLDSNNQMQYAMDGFFFDLDRIQPYIASELLQEFGVSANVDCGATRYRVLKAGARLSCSVTGVPSTRIVNVKVLANGGIFIYNPPGLKSAETSATQPLIAKHKKGQQVIVSQAVLEQSFRTLEALLQQKLAKENVRIEGLSCPKTADISGDKRAICNLDVSGRNIQLAFWIKNSDWNMETVQVVFPRAKMEAAAARYYAELERNNGFNVPVSVHCPWPDLLVVTPPATRDCALVVDNVKHRLTIRMPDHNGSFSYYVSPK
jgi:hypothetical protein